MVQRTRQQKSSFAERQKNLLAERYELTNRPAQGVTMSRGKAVQEGVRVRLTGGVTWEQLAAMTPEELLTTRPDLGDVSKGQLVTLANFYELFGGILNPKQIEGLRLLLTPFPQQQFNATDDRRSLLRR